MRDFDDILKESLKDPEFKKEYDALELEYSIIAQVIKKKIRQGFKSKTARRKDRHQTICYFQARGR